MRYKDSFVCKAKSSHVAALRGNLRFERLCDGYL